MKKIISVLGSTGSVGTQTLEVAQNLNIKIEGLSANKNIKLLEKQIRIFKPSVAAVYDEKCAETLKKNVKDTFTKIVSGTEGLCTVSSLTPVDTVVTAVSGIIGLIPTAHAIKFGKNIALANKETLVAGGYFIMDMAKKHNVKILPVDSEHSAIFQCLQKDTNEKNIKKLILTASGGPFFGKSSKELENATLSEALNHPSWNMGKKITVDSATMMNKGLEIIEAAHLFGISPENIDVLVHRESVVHSMVEFEDGAVLAQMGTPSMKTPIQYALTFPLRTRCNVKPLNLAEYKFLSFFEPDHKTFESINICKEAFLKGKEACVVLNASNEKAVELFLNKKIKFSHITKLVRKTLSEFKPQKINSLEDVTVIDAEAKKFTENLITDNYLL